MPNEDGTIEEKAIENSSTANEEAFKLDDSLPKHTLASELRRKEYEQLGKSSFEIINELKKYLDLQKKEIEEEAIETKKELEEKIENHKLTIIETLGIFVALFTFISVDFQVFKSYRNPWAISGLSLILLGSISFLIIIFDFFILQARAIKNSVKNVHKGGGIISGLYRRAKSNPTRVAIFTCSFSFILLGIFLFHKAPLEKFQGEIEKIQQEIIESTRIDIKKDIDDQRAISEGNSLKIEDLERAVNYEKKCVRNFGFTIRCFQEN